ncbi:hypothetical protein OMAG_002970 [Candidatus Omnitrophus magneticus]|uniref:Uncharacterized protein n=1 Tax=Candidatus Omnitrophus magneticus TaxID=1609969 RepID=A0A0F0CP18_9BACT|nr:hypothetical protein OMAG_002970 [Candidatus Omnitrophus magneticus]
MFLKTAPMAPIKAQCSWITRSGISNISLKARIMPLFSATPP